MVKLLTTLINNTDKVLPIYEESSNGALTMVVWLGPKHDPTTTPTTNDVSENSRSTQELPNSYVYSVDPNDSYATIRIWCGKKPVLSASCDEVIENRTITIEFKDENFIKQLEPRNVKKKPASTSGKLLQPPLSSNTSEAAASTSEGDASNKKDLLGDIINIFRPHKSANSNADN